MDRQKILLIFGGAFVAAIVLTFLLFRVTQAPKAQETVALVAAAHEMSAGTRLKKGDLKVIHVLKQDAPPGAITDEKVLIDRPLLFPVSANETITPTKVSSIGGVEGVPSQIEIGKRALSVQVNDPSGVAGLIQPRSHVDVLFTRPGSMVETVTTTILEDIVVLGIGRATEVAGSLATAGTATAATANATPQTNQNRSATLLVTPEQSRVLELAKNQGRISLALRNPMDTTRSSDPRATTGEALYGNLPKELRPDLRRPTNNAPAVRVVAAPKPEPPPAPPKPKNIVEVFRGDKHSVEKF
jgi:pilus assembly protein CpaB